MVILARNVAATSYNPVESGTRRPAAIASSAAPTAAAGADQPVQPLPWALPMPKSKEDQVAAIVAKWKPRLLLDGWAVIPSLERESKAGNGQQWLAAMDVNRRYTDARLTIYPDFWKDNKATQTVTLVHELLHIPTNAVREELSKLVSLGKLSEKRKDELVEQLVEYMAKVVYRAYTRSSKKKGYL